jgi:hypothetical protein
MVSISIRKGKREVILNFLMLTRASASQDYVIVTILRFSESKETIFSKLKMLKHLIKPLFKLQKKLIPRKSEA